MSMWAGEVNNLGEDLQWAMMLSLWSAAVCSQSYTAATSGLSISCTWMTAAACGQSTWYKVKLYREISDAILPPTTSCCSVTGKAAICSSGVISYTLQVT